jgi:hypothetical protein
VIEVVIGEDAAEFKVDRTALPDGEGELYELELMRAPRENTSSAWLHSRWLRSAHDAKYASYTTSNTPTINESAPSNP